MTSATGESSTRGFTLIEICVVLAILGLATVLTWADLSRARKKISARAAATELKSVLQSARDKAVVTGAPVCVTSAVLHQFPTSPFSVEFLPDGSSNEIRVVFPLDGGDGYELHLDSMGRLDVSEFQN